MMYDCYIGGSVSRVLTSMQAYTALVTPKMTKHLTQMFQVHFGLNLAGSITIFMHLHCMQIEIYLLKRIEVCVLSYFTVDINF